VIDEPPGLPADRVRAAWDLDVDTAAHLPVGAGSWHWHLADDVGPEWFATVDRVRTAHERQALLAAFEATASLAATLPFVVAPVRTRDARIAVDVAPGLLLTVTPFLEVAACDSPAEDDVARARAASLLGDLHSGGRPRNLQAWTPRIGWHAHAGRGELEACLDAPVWSGGPWSGPAGRLLADVAPVVRAAVRRFRLLGAAVAGSVDRWVVTHGQPHDGNVVTTPDGPRLVDWGTVRLAPRERDLREVLAGADGDEPWFAYVEAGGRPDALSPDALELFALEWHLSEIAEYAVLFSRPHEDTSDGRRGFGDLELELVALVERWGGLA
jgi:spectinomycin phosphotransferase